MKHCRWIAALICFALCLSFLPQPAYAAGATETADFSKGDGSAALALLNAEKPGSAAWDAGGKVLTLTNAQFHTAAETAVILPEGATIVLSDGTENTISLADRKIQNDNINEALPSQRGIYAKGSLTIRGGGSLNVSSGNLENSGVKGIEVVGLYVNGALNIENGTVIAEGNTARVTGYDPEIEYELVFSFGVFIKSGDLTMRGGSLYGISGKAAKADEDDEYDSQFSYGVYVAHGGIKMSGDARLSGTVIEEEAGNDLLKNGICVFEGNVEVSDSAEIFGEGFWGMSLEGGSLKQTGGKIILRTASDQGGSALHCDEGVPGLVKEYANVTITDGEFQAVGMCYAYARKNDRPNAGNFVISGGKATLTGDVYGFYDFAVRGGEVAVDGKYTLLGQFSMEQGSLVINARRVVVSINIPYAAALQTEKFAMTGGTMRVFGSDILDDEYISLILAESEAKITGGTLLIDGSAAGQRAFQVRYRGEKIGEEKVYDFVIPIYDYPYGTIDIADTMRRSGLDEGKGVITQRYADTPAVLSDMECTAVTASGVTAQDKIYDGTVAATLDGVISGAPEGAEIRLGTGGVTATFADSNVGENKPIQASGEFDLRGANAYQYRLDVQPDGLSDLKATIKPAMATDVTKPEQTYYLGDASFEGARFEGVSINGEAEAVTGTIRYRVANDTMSAEELLAHLNRQAAGSKVEVFYSFIGTGNYAQPETEQGSIVVTIARQAGGGSSSSGSSSRTMYYTVKVNQSAGGTVSASASRAEKGKTVTLTLKASEGYLLESLTVRKKSGDAIDVLAENGVYRFTMPAENVNVWAKFAQKPTKDAAFSDVAKDAYYADAVAWGAQKQIVNGVGGGLFDPNGVCTRAQVVTMLWRASGSPAASGSASFSDVAADAYYAAAVAWASGKGIANGVGGGLFDPNGVCTRAQIVTMLWRAQGSPAASGSASFSDVAADAYYAAAVAWASGQGIVNGVGDGLFDPNGICTRAQVVTMLYRIFGE